MVTPLRKTILFLFFINTKIFTFNLFKATAIFANEIRKVITRVVLC